MRRGAWLHLALAGALVALGLVLAWPRPRSPQLPQITWATLLAPLGPGAPVGSGFVLGAPRRGREGDLEIVATRETGGASVEVHVVARGQWGGTLETASFGVAYELPRSTAPSDDCLAVTRTVWAALRRNDPGGLVPGEVALGAGAGPQTDPPLVRLGGLRGALVAAALALGTALLATAPRGGLLSAVWLLGLGLLLRAPRLGLPFRLDQDVQRMFTGHLPLRAILTGQGLDDRHPPLYFLVLHVAQWAGQSEAVGRAPAVLAGALVGPAILRTAWVSARARGPAVAVAALVATVSPELVLRSREVSEIPLFALVALGACASYAAAIARPSRRPLTAVAASAALALYTYYLAPLVLAGSVALGWLGRRTTRRAVRAAALGAALGAPALLLELRIFAHDEGARQAARAHPALAWGEHGALDMARQLGQTALETLGAPLLTIVAAVALAAIACRHVPALVPLGALAATFGGVALVAPVARVQAYYLTAVLPLALLAIAVGLPRSGVAAWVSAAVVAVAGLGAALARAPGALAMYVRAPDEIMSDVARVVDGRPERRILLTVDYDTTLLAYDLARRHAIPMDWARMHHEGSEVRLEGLPQVLEPLVRVHTPGEDPEGRALARLDAVTAREDVLVVARKGLGLVALDARLSRCASLLDGEAAQLVLCARR